MTRAAHIESALRALATVAESELLVRDSPPLEAAVEQARTALAMPESLPTSSLYGWADEAAKKAIEGCVGGVCAPVACFEVVADALVDARGDTLEEAARQVERHAGVYTTTELAAAIRALGGK